MVKLGMDSCPKCGGVLLYYDRVKRVIRGKYGKKSCIYLKRLKCQKCHSVHRAIPKDLYSYKQYEAEIINGVLNGYITIFTLGFEDYPCEATMFRWLAEFTTSIVKE